MRTIFALLVSAYLLASCSVQPGGQADEPFTTADWIGSTQSMPASDSAFYTDHPAPVFQKVFDLRKKPQQAELAVTAAGYYTVWINDQQIGDDFLSPAWTDVTKRIYYRSYDVAAYLESGTNEIRVELGNGWYHPLPLRMWGHANLRERLPVGQPRFILDLQTRQGRRMMHLVSDSTWSWAPGEILRNNVYLGEHHSMLKKPASFTEAVQVLPAPGGLLQLADFEPIRKTAEQKPVSVWRLGQNRLVVDFGQNMAGTFRYDGPVSPGDSLIFRLGERIWPDSTVNTMTAVCGQIKRRGVGGPGAPDVAEQRCVFIPASEGDAFEPRYSFQGFRYIEVYAESEELISQLEAGHFTAWRMGTDIRSIGETTSDAEWLNTLNSVMEWTLLSNVFSVISDCPAREKFGYGGDLNATAETWLYQFDAKNILIKTVRDWQDAMKDDRFVDTAPFVGIQYCGIAWESVYLMVQDWLWRFYADTTLVREWYDENVQWMEKAGRLLGQDLVRSGLADHESLLPVPVQLVGSLHYYRSMRIMENFAGLAGQDADAERYRNMANSYQRLLVDSLWKDPVLQIANPQTWLSGLITHRILDDADHQRAVEQLVEDLRARDLKLTTGIFGTAWMLEALGANGYADLAFEFISQEDFPGWRHMLNQGATTIWETWKESDNVFSQNHPMFTSVSAFLHKWIGGIQPAHAGFSDLILRPCPVDGLEHFQARRQTSVGFIALRWEWNKQEIRFFVDLPEGVHAIWNPQMSADMELAGIRMDRKGPVSPVDWTGEMDGPIQTELTYRPKLRE